MHFSQILQWGFFCTTAIRIWDFLFSYFGSNTFKLPLQIKSKGFLAIRYTKILEIAEMKAYSSDRGYQI